ncbi:MAG: universal stress protein [Proteobacteria bacterium]|nr:universal stress protein [Pseudomonadota bacterium]
MAIIEKKRILFALDGSEASFAALRYASTLIPPDRYEAVLYHVFDMFPEAYWDIRSRPEDDPAFVSLEAWAEVRRSKVKVWMAYAGRLLEESGLPADSMAYRLTDRILGVGRDIITEAGRGYDAVVIGLTGSGRKKGLVLGDTANKLLNGLSEVSLCLVGGRPDPGKILMAMDPSRGSQRALAFMAPLIGGRACQVKLFHAVRSLLAGTHPDEVLDRFESIESTRTEEARGAMRPVFEEARAILVRAGLKETQIETRIATAVESRAGAIVDEALSGGYDTIVVGRKGLSQFEDFFIGRVSNKVALLVEEAAVWIID